MDSNLVTALAGVLGSVSGTPLLTSEPVTVTFLPLLKAPGLGGACAIYAVATAISLPFVWIAVHETKGKTLEQMKVTPQK